MTEQSTSLFWDNYISKTKAYRIKSTSARWYVRHAETYIRAHANLRLAQHSAPQMEKYLREKGRNSYLEDWQFKQMVVALKILFVEMVKTSWASSFAWDDWVVAADSLPNSHATVARDYQAIAVDQKEALDYGAADSDSNLYKRVVNYYPEHIRAFIEKIRVRRYSIRTERAYLGWILRYISFYSMQDPAKLTEKHIARYLEYLVLRRKVASSTQSQALNALMFFYRQVLQRELNERIEFVHSRKPRRLPVVLTADEIKRLFSGLENTTQLLMANLLYGCGLRLMECVRLRILDVDFGYQQILVRNTKAKKDRVVPILKKLTTILEAQIDKVKALHY